ncbi:hypothetical protein K7432_014583 [Basidiobolus ranarum]|uniref:Uncharacterized protein n=1 Tax=Basidiobolus ranarum TaxID=34480 RepID=A0ABR2WHD2_9FUNG
MLKLIFFALTLMFVFSHALPIGSSVNQGQLIIQDLSGALFQSAQEIEQLSDLQLAEDDALYDGDLIYPEDDEDYDHVYINDYNAYLAMVEDDSTWKQ